MIISKENPKTLFVAAIIWIAILVLIFFPKNKNIVTTEQQNNSAEQSSDVSKMVDAESLMKIFITQYNSYTTGNFSNIESLYTFMTESMQETEKQRTESLKLAFEQNPKEYTTIESEVKEYKEIKREEDLVAAEIITEKITFDGAFIPEPDSEDELVICVDKSGNATEENLYYSSAKKISEAFQVVAMKENGEWKIAQIQKISE